MKKWIIGILLLMLAGCAGAPAEEANSDKLQVYTSFYAMYDFTRAIAGDYADVENLVPAGVEPHDWEPSPADMICLEEADVFIYSGKGMESWCEKVLSSLSNTELLAVETAKDIPALAENGNSDPHVWLNPQNAAVQMQTIAAALSEKDPANTAYYQKNLQEQLEKLSALDTKYQQTLSACPKKEMIVSHKAYGYLCDAYGLEQIAAEGLAADGDASPAKLATLVETMQNKNIRYIFFEEQIESKALQTVQAETGAEALVLNPFETNTGDKDYFAVMEQNLENLQIALSGE